MYSRSVARISGHGKDVSMYCRVCGSEDNVSYRYAQRQVLCAYCLKDTPRKIGYEEFKAKYFPAPSECPESTMRDFYDDYKTSSLTFVQYCEHTVGKE
jgi:hypothetical protein